MHLKKLCVGCDSIDDLAAWQNQRLKQMRSAGQKPQLRHVTRHMPKQYDAIVREGSLYWIIKGWMVVRQKITGLETIQNEEGESRCAILLDKKLVRVAPTAHRPFQGWRYLAPEDAPNDILESDDQIPAELAAELRGLGLF